MNVVDPPNVAKKTTASLLGEAPRTPAMQFSLAQATRLARRQIRLAAKLAHLGERVTVHQNARLTVGLVFCVVLVVAAIFPQVPIGFPAFVIFIPLFWTLVVRTRNLKRHRDLLVRLGDFWTRQEQRTRGLVANRPFERAAERVAFSPLIRDLNLIGPHSLWTLLDETLTDGGENELASWVFSHPLKTGDILARQKQIQGLRREAWFYTKLTLLAGEIASDDVRVSTSQILDFVRSSFTTPTFRRTLSIVWLLWTIMVVTFLWKSFGGSPMSLKIAPLALVAFAAVNIASANKTARGFKKGTGLSHHLSQLAPIFKALEIHTAKSARIRELCPSIFATGPAREARRLNVALGFLGVETNPLLHLLLNALTPWSMTATLFLERARLRIADSFPKNLNELNRLEALGSLVIFDHYQTQVYPVLDSEKLDFSLAFHPLIDREHVVANDFAYPTGKTLGLLTGSNMSGKSTFLRTVGINQILLNMGAPVFAERFHSRPLRLESCIEVSDSLRDGFSYFYAEVRRLKALLESAKQHNDVLFLIDEIFRGTNNRERQIGSRAVIRHLAETARAQGFVSTHDLELTQMEETMPALMNLHFREEIRGSEMVFPYRLLMGPCPTTNALIIIEMEGIHITASDRAGTI